MGSWGVLYGAESGSMGSLSTSLTPQLMLGPGMKKFDGIGNPETTQAVQEIPHKY